MKLPRLAFAGFLVILFALTATSCARMLPPQGWASPLAAGANIYIFEKKDHLSAVSFDQDGRATTHWTFPNKDNPKQKNIRLEAVYTTPILDGDHLYLGSYKGEVMSLAASDGELLWRNTAATGSIVGGPVLAGDILLFGTTENRLYALNKSDGGAAPGWPASGISLGAPIWAAPVISDGVAFVATMRGEVRAIRLADHSDAWPAPFKISGAIPALSLLDAGHLFVPGINRSVSIVDTATGKTTAPAFHASDWVWTNPAFKDGVAYFGDFSGDVYALDITTGALNWTYRARHKVKSGPALVDGVLVLADRNPVVHFINPANGAALNTVPLLDAGTVRADVAPQETTALIVTTKGKLFRADPKTRSVPDVPLDGGSQ